jgi:hydroxyethylthiazole kinase-like uncharacterized protein yjeF
MKLVTAVQMRDLEAQAIADGTDILNLMDAAGLAAAQEAWMALRIIEDRLVLIVAGPGNNGADGIIAAFHLREMGAQVHVYMLTARAAEDDAWQALQDHEIPHTIATDDLDFTKLDALLDEASGVLDALLGTGTNRPIEGAMAEVLRRLEAASTRTSRRPQIIALDVPSGVNADTGRVDPLTVAADVTVGFGYVKVGMFQTPGRTFGGQIIRADIGLPEPAAELPFEEIEYRMAQRGIPARDPDGHKGTFGRVVVAAGSTRYPGAAVLAAEAAARSGAGLVVVAAPAEAQALVVTRFPDAVHEPLPSTDGAVNGDSALALLRALPGATSLLVGPGLGHTPATEAFMRNLLAGLDAVEGLRAVVLDADALNALASQPGWYDSFQLPRIVTPHPGEMARLLGVTVDVVQTDRLGVAVEYAHRINGVVILKGAGTIIATPDGRARFSGVSNSMLAHAGTGDVLAGLLAGFLAQGAAPYEAATAAVYVHSETASVVVKEYGEAAGLAQDLLRALPEVRKSLDARVGAASSPLGGMGMGLGGMDLSGGGFGA